MAVRKSVTSRRSRPSSDTYNEPSSQSHQYDRPSPFQASGIIILLLVALSFVSGYLLGNVKPLKSGALTTSPTAQDPAAAQQPPPQVEVSADLVKKLFTEENLSFGDASKKVLFVEISDPSCPYCHVADGLDSQAIPGEQFKYVSEGGTYTPPLPEMRKLVEAGQASYVMLYANGHGNGRLATEALYCADEQGKFWEVHDRLMTNEGYNLINNTVQNDRSKAGQLVEFLGTAADSASLTQCLESAKYEKRLTEDEQTAVSLGFQGTPHFLVNTTQFGGAQDWKQMEPAVQEALQ